MRKSHVIIILLFLVVVIALQYVGIKDFLTLEKVKGQKHILKYFVEQNYLLAVLLFISFFTLASFLSIPITIILNLLAGFLFGALPAALYVNIGTTAGCTLSFLAFRYLLGFYVKERYGEKLKEFNVHIKKYGYSYLLSAQILPATPMFLINALGGVTSLSIWTFIWTTSIGILPGSLVYTFAGQQLGKIESAKEILSWQMIIVLIFLASLAILPAVISKMNCRKA